MYKVLPIRFCLVCLSLILFTNTYSQYKWTNVNAEFGVLPASVQVFRCTDSIQGKPSVAYYVKAKLKDKRLIFTTDSSFKRRLTPSQFYAKNSQPILIVNGTFFDFASNRNLNVLVKNGKLTSYNVHDVPLRGKDTGSYYMVTRSALGIRSNRAADVAWIYSDSARTRSFAFQKKPVPWRDTSNVYTKKDFEKHYGSIAKKWKVHTAIGGGPVLVQDGRPLITNDEERMFMGKARHDRHPRTAMGYTADGYLIVLVVEGRHKGVAEGASLVHLADMLVGLGCTEALNLDGGGSTCLLINGKETIKPSDKEGERPVPGVFIIAEKR
ncbi:MAG TPA: phosphodiester glycosidase family protein [Chitinophagaceae bacterium]|nr:phosphodiester glycosidase family protein [Chitinophagaceae bacterium]